MKEVWTAKNEDGIETTYEILFKFTNPKTNIKYLVWTDNSRNSNNELNIYTSRYNVVNDSYVMSEIENDEEYDFVDKMIELEVGD